MLHDYDRALVVPGIVAGDHRGRRLCGLCNLNKKEYLTLLRQIVYSLVFDNTN